MQNLAQDRKQQEIKLKASLMDQGQNSRVNPQHTKRLFVGPMTQATICFLYCSFLVQNVASKKRARQTLTWNAQKVCNARNCETATADAAAGAWEQYYSGDPTFHQSQLCCHQLRLHCFSELADWN